MASSPPRQYTAVSDGGEWIAGSHLEKVDGLHHRALGDRMDRHQRRIARQHVDQARRKGADRALAAMDIAALDPLVQAARIGEVLLHHLVQQVLAQILAHHPELVLHDPAREHVGLRRQIETGLEIRVPGDLQTLTAGDEEIDDVGEFHVEQRPRLRTRRDRGVEIDPGAEEIHAQIAGFVAGLGAFDKDAAHKEGRGDGARLGLTGRILVGFG
jgi:hypothetical protein